MEKKLAKIRPYYKYEITELYEISIKTLMKRIKPAEKFMKIVGYNKSQKIFTLKQTETIFENVGHPFANETSGKYSNKKVPIFAYSKQQLAEFYNISGKTLLAQIEAIPYDNVKMVIMDANKISWQRRRDKNNFKREEVRLIFEWLGHPCDN